MSATSKAVAVVNPYDAKAPENQLANVRPDAKAIALRSELGKLLLNNESEFAVMARAAGVEPEGPVLQLIAAARKKPEILKCTEPSIMTFMFDVITLGLVVGRGVFPVPVNHGQGRDREKRLEAWVGYVGAKELACRGGAIRDCWADVVFEGDDYVFTSAPVPMVTKHVKGPNYGNMKKALKAYATLLYPGHLTRSKEFTRDQIEAFRKKNRGDTTAASSPWVTNTQDMWQAKAILHTTKDLPRKSEAFAHAMAILDRQASDALPSEGRVALPAGGEVSAAADPEPEEAVEMEEVLEPQEMALGVAITIPVTLKGGKVRMMGELRNSGVEAVLAWAREKLESDPESVPLTRIAEAAARVLKARHAGEHPEPPKPAEIG